MTSAEVDSPQDKNLLIVKYARAQKTSPDFLTIYEGITQSVDITISTVIFRAAPEPVLTLYDFVMTTFVPKSEAPATNAAMDQPTSTDELQPNPQMGGSAETIRVKVKLASVQSGFVSFTAHFQLLTLLQKRFLSTTISTLQHCPYPLQM